MSLMVDWKCVFTSDENKPVIIVFTTAESWLLVVSFEMASGLAL